MLYLSVNTVKTHLKHIYGKLDVGNRRDAAALAQRMGLIE
jgi:LuxR family maltose regulon positive regulatory protein